MNYYKRYMGDYARDTAHLSLLEHGAYALLLDAYYATCTPLPADFSALYRICRTQTPAEQKAVRAVAQQFFPVAGDGLRHNSGADKRLPEELARVERSRRNGARGGRRSRPGPDDYSDAATPPGPNPSGTQQVPQRVAEQQTQRASSPNPNPNPVLLPPSSPAPTTAACAIGADSAGGPGNPRDPGAVAFLEAVHDEQAAAVAALEDPERALAKHVAFAVELRRRGVQCTSAHPELMALADDGFTVPELVEALEVACAAPTAPRPMKVGYLAAVARTERERSRRPARSEAAWWASEEATMVKANELGLMARGGESWEQFRDRIRQALGAKRRRS